MNYNKKLKRKLTLDGWNFPWWLKDPWLAGGIFWKKINHSLGVLKVIPDVILIIFRKAEVNQLWN